MLKFQKSRDIRPLPIAQSCFCAFQEALQRVSIAKHHDNLDQQPEPSRTADRGGWRCTPQLPPDTSCIAVAPFGRIPPRPRTRQNSTTGWNACEQNWLNSWAVSPLSSPEKSFSPQQQRQLQTIPFPKHQPDTGMERFHSLLHQPTGAAESCRVSNPTACTGWASTEKQDPILFLNKPREEKNGIPSNRPTKLKTSLVQSLETQARSTVW